MSYIEEIINKHQPQQSWLQTNVKKHIDIIKGSNRVKEITALKIWRNNHELKRY